MRVVQLKPVLLLFGTKEWKLLKITSMGLDVPADRHSTQRAPWAAAGDFVTPNKAQQENVFHLNNPHTSDKYQSI
jgi:hypothetical protein